MTSTNARPRTCPDENVLVLLADGNLSETARASIDRHLDGCARCTCLVAELAGMARPVLPVPTRYNVIRQLGAGAMGVVWEAEDTHLGRRVALKFVRAEVEGSRRRLSREARALAQLRHPNVVTVFDVGDSGAELFLALELVIGTDAVAWRTAQPRTTQEIVAVWRQVAEGLGAAHRAGILHRDIKPENVLVAEDGRVLLTDFGLATDHRATVQRHATATALGVAVDAPVYMAYEQLLGEPASRASDQYALCASMWEAIAGERPFVGRTLGAVAMAMQQAPVVPSSLRRSDARILGVLARGLDPNPAKRWPSVDVLVAALERAETLERRGARRTARNRRRYQTMKSAVLALGAAALAATATLGVLAWRDGRRSSASHVAFVAPADATPTEREVALIAHLPTSDVADPHRRHTAQVPAPRPAPTPTIPTDGVLERARTKLAAGDGRGCLEQLGPAKSEEASILRATCTMKSGDCATGRAMLEATARENAWDWSRLEMTLRMTDFANCPLDAEPRSMWGERARYRLMVAVSEKRSCAPVLAFIAKQGVSLPDEREGYLLEASCRINDGDCASARASWRRSYTFAERDRRHAAEQTRIADAVFAKTYPRCR